MKFRELKLRKDPECPVCGSNPTIKALIDYEEFCGLRHLDEAAQGPPPPDFHITSEDVKKRIDRGESLTLVDVREPQEFEIVRLPGAILMPLGDLERRLPELDPARELIVYCHRGVRSVRAVAYMRHLGFTRARNLVGGITECPRRMKGGSTWLTNRSCSAQRLARRSFAA